MRFQTVSLLYVLCHFTFVAGLLDGISFSSLLSRQEEDPLCSPELCGGGSCRRDFVQFLHPRWLLPGVRWGESELRPSSREIASSEAGNLPLDKRDISRPRQGQLDQWFEEQWSSSNTNRIKEVDVNWDPAAVSYFETKFERWGNSPMLLGVRRMFGCMGIVIASSKAGFMAHIWENPTIGPAENGEEEALLHFASDMMVPLKNELECYVENNIFNRTGDTATRVAIYGKKRHYSQNAADSPYKYPTITGRIKQMLLEIIPGLEMDHIIDMPYYAWRSISEDTTVADGKVLLAYDPRAQGNKPGYQLWAGAVVKQDTNEKIPHESVNEPYMEAYWRA